MFLLLCACAHQPASENPQVLPQAETMLGDVMAYIRGHHPDAAPLIPDDLKWQETSATKAPGYSSVTYSAGGWKVTIGHAMTPEPVYEIRAEYADGKIVWLGTIKDSAISEESYSSR